MNHTTTSPTGTDPGRISRSFSRQTLYTSDIVIERHLLETISPFSLFGPKSQHSRHFIITDSRVDKLHAERIFERFSMAGLVMEKLVIPEGEESKNFRQYETLTHTILATGIDKYSCLISVGGGVINNITGFLASTIYRGIGLMHIPTSMMAQVDAAIDFKQAINSPHGKNLTGSYYPARKILIDPEVLSTLDRRHLMNGISESIKHALVQDKTFYEYLMNHQDDMQDMEFLNTIIARSINLKLELVQGDVRDDKNEMLQQYGHSIGHAFEHSSKYDLLHGEAIAIGMCVSAEISHLLGFCTKDVVEAHYTIFKKYELPTNAPKEITDDQICKTIFYDKHFVKTPYMALPRTLGAAYEKGDVYSVAVGESHLREALQRNRARA